MEYISMYAFSSVVIVSLISFVGVFTLSLSNEILKKVIFFGVSLSVGALFGDTFIHLIPSALQKIENPDTVALLVLTGIISFFVLEKFLAWRHTHTDGHIEKNKKEEFTKPIGTMILVSDGIHNLIDGVIIGASYLVSVEIGIATTLAIILHEIPQEIGNFGILLNAGFKKTRALFLNFVSSLTAIAGTAIALSLGGSFEYFIYFATAITAGSFVYIAGSDIVPELQKTSDPKKSALQLLSIIIGVLLILATKLAE